jgi:GH35 family endo-1,4-beta-xylanase
MKMKKNYSKPLNFYSLGLLLLLAIISKAQNIIPNPGFELGAANDFTNWTKQNGSAYLTATTAPAEIHGGARALKSASPGFAGNQWQVQMLSDGAATTIGTSYTFKIWAKAATAGGTIRFSTQPSALYGGDTNVPAGVWTQLSWTFTANEANTQIALDLGQSNVVYYLDDMELTAATVPPVSANLLNPGFELGSGDDFTNWTKTNGSGFLTATTMAAEVHSGTRALKSAGPGYAGNQWQLQILSDPVATTIGTDYTFKIWVNAATAGGNIRFSTQPNALYSGDMNVPDGVWTQLSWTFTANEANTKISLDLGQSNVIYYLDDMELTSPPVIAANCLILNGGLELGTGDDFTNWGKWNNPGGNALVQTMVPAEVKSGTRALKVISPGGNPWETQFVSDPIALTVGAKYTFSFYIKGQVASGTTVRASTNETTAQYSGDYNVTGDWTKFTWTITATNASTRFVLDLGKNANTYFIDDICLEILCDGSFAPPASQTPIATGKTKFLGNIWSPAQAVNSDKYFNQVTPENAGKWGSVETSDQVFNWTDVDAARKYADDHGFPFRFHVLLWGSQQPTWLKPMTDAQKLVQIKQWFTAVKDHFNASSGAFKKPEFIEVMNETLNDPPNNLDNATVAYPWRPSNINDGGSGDYVNALKTLNTEYGTTPGNYDWIVNAFKLAREIFGCDSKLMINEYSLESIGDIMNEYKSIIQKLKADNLIDAVGMQTHTFSTQLYNEYTPANITANTANLQTQLDALAAENLPVMITELDIDGDVSLDASGNRVTTGTQAEKDAFQRSEYERIFPVYWNHTSVIGITLWGYRTGHWRSSNAAYIMDGCSGAGRPAMDYLNTIIRGSSPTVASFNAAECPANAISGKIMINVAPGASSPLGTNPLNGSTYPTYLKLIKNGVVKHVSNVLADGSYTFFKVIDGDYSLKISNNFDNLATDLYTPPTGLTLGIEGIYNPDGTPIEYDETVNGLIPVTITAGIISITAPATARKAASTFGNVSFGLVGSPLPIDLISFAAHQIDEQIALNWKTANEKSFSHFEVQKGLNNKEFSSFDKIGGQSKSNYSAIDFNPENGLNYYRLKMVDLDGTTKYSKIISQEFNKNNAFLTVINPAENGEIKINTNLINPEFNLFNSAGQKLDFKKIESSLSQFSILPLEVKSGIYFLTVKNDNKQFTKKIIFK